MRPLILNAARSSARTGERLPPIAPNGVLTPSMINESCIALIKYGNNLSKLDEIDARNPGVNGQFRRIDESRFNVVIFRRGQELTSGTVWLGDDSGMGRGINYVHGTQSSSNTYNEILSVTDDGFTQFLKGFGLYGNEDENMNQHGAAEHLWRQVIERLQ